MNYKFLIDKKVIKDLKKIDKKWQIKIINTIKTKLIQNPFMGKKLIGNLSAFYRYRVGDYRIIYRIKKDEVVIDIVKIKHRKEIYKCI